MKPTVPPDGNNSVWTTPTMACDMSDWMTFSESGRRELVRTALQEIANLHNIMIEKYQVEPSLDGTKMFITATVYYPFEKN